MKFSEKIRERVVFPTPLLFVIAIGIIVAFLPREGKYNYTYEETKPWQYGLLTAPFNFHIHKSQARIEHEKDSIMQSFQSYYKITDEELLKAIGLLKADTKATEIPAEYIKYVSRKLSEIYKAGIISTEDYDKIQLQPKKQITISDNSTLFETRYLVSFYTPRLAYEKIFNDAPVYIHASVLRNMNVNNYLNINVKINEDLSAKAKEDLLTEMSLYEGDIQSGEKIIDRGEIVDARSKAILDSYQYEIKNKMGTKMKPGWLVLGELILVSLFILSLLLFLKFYRISFYNDKKSVIFLLSFIVFFSIVVSFIIGMKLSNIIYVIPFAISPILIRTFIDSRTAMYVHLITVSVCTMMLPITQMPQFFIVQTLIGFSCIFSLTKLSERSQLIYCSLFLLLTYFIAFTAWVLATEGDISILKDNWRIYFYFCINFIFVSFAYLLVYVCEKLFGYISEVSMIELSNTNRELLHELSEKAPGTFQHSMQVSNLVVSAAVKIGANSALVRTGALYHDIGKMTNPAFFTENQSQGMNPHSMLSEKESAKIIIGHIEEGVRLAKKHKLPQQIIDFISTHHGEGKAKYFYNSYANSHPEEVVDIADFTYPGPNPFSKETALLMMADAVEASSRSLTEYNEASISGLVNRMIDTQLNDGLFRNTPLTFKDVEIIKEVFIDKLMTIYHTRIAYPELKEKAKTETTKTKE